MARPATIASVAICSIYSTILFLKRFARVAREFLHDSIATMTPVDVKRTYQLNQPYALARALEAALTHAIFTADEEVIATVRGIVHDMARFLVEYDQRHPRSV